MALQTVLKNICSYLEILDASRSPQVALWDATSLHNALQWAAYCQQIYTQSKGKPYSTQLDQEIRRIGEMMMVQQRTSKRNKVTEIGLEMLEQSYSLLIASLLANVHLKRETLSLLTSDALPVQAMSHVVKECSHQVQSKAVFELLSAINNDFHHQSEDGSSSTCCYSDALSQSKTRNSFGCSCSASKLQTSEDLTALCLAQMLLRFLTNTLQEDAHASERNKIQSMLVERFGQTDLGQAVLMTSFLNLKSSGIRSANSCVKNVLEECLKLLVNQNNASFLSSLLLIRVCNESFEVYGHYVKHLVKCCEELRPVYGTYPVSHPHQLAMWRLPPAPVGNSNVPVSLGYEDVKGCLVLLLSSGSSQVASATDRLLRLLAGRQETSAIWSTLLNDLHRMNVVCS